MSGNLLPIDRMLERVKFARQTSDTDLFNALMYLGETLTKLVAAGLVAVVPDDQERRRYNYLHRLVRSDGLGDWSATIDEVTSGSSVQYTLPQARDEFVALTQRCGPGTWQYESYERLNICLKAFDITSEDPPTKIMGRMWFSNFVRLRNKTRAHGAPLSGVYTATCPYLEQSIQLFIDNLSLLQRPWAFVQRKLSGSYRVTKLTNDDIDSWSDIVANSVQRLRDGVYISYGTPVFVELLHSDVDATDFSFPNGQFDGKRFELLSYISGKKTEHDASAYLAPPTGLPKSETEGLSGLEIQGYCFGNLPPLQETYIRRRLPENDLYTALTDSRHPVVTLVGRGGIGKTSLALSVLHKVAADDNQRFSTILWFSARDIDLLSEGPKQVRPHVLTERDIAKEIVRLVEPKEVIKDGMKPVQYLTDALGNSPIGSLLLVFDNFETVNSPVDLFKWLDTYIRLPNKILITTRFRDFKADYPIEVTGMTEDESNELVDSTSGILNVRHLLSPSYRHRLFNESDGHPYVIKVLLGEVAKAGREVKIERTIAGKEEILDALFERIYGGLSVAAKRVFLTLCSCRSIVPQLAVEAVLLRPDNEKMDVEKAIEEVFHSSFVDRVVSDDETYPFLVVPSVAVQFGGRKLAVSTLKTAVEADTQLLTVLGIAKRSGVQEGVGPRIESLFEMIGNKIKRQQTTLAEHLDMMEFIARRYPPAWMHLAALHERLGADSDLEHAKEAVTRYLERPVTESEQTRAWNKLVQLSRQTKDLSTEIHARLELCQIRTTRFEVLSSAADDFVRLKRAEGQLFSSYEWNVIVQRLGQAIEERLDEANGTDFSRLGWLYLCVAEDDKAWRVVQRGLYKDPDNYRLRRLEDRFRDRIR